MTVRPHPSQQFVRVAETSETVSAGRLTFAYTQQLQYLRVLILKYGAGAGTEQIRAKLYHDSSLTKLFATSSWSELSDISGLSTYWRGWLRLDFAGEWVRASDSLHVALETQGYTRNAGTFYLAYVLDWPLTSATQSTSRRAGVAMEPYGYRKVAY